MPFFFRAAIFDAARAGRAADAECAYDLAIAVDDDGKLALGSNWPDGPLAPMKVIGTVVPGISLTQALQAYTVNGAYASYDEGRKGFIKRGMLADIVVLSDDIFSLEPSELSKVTVAYTIFDGRIVYPTKQRRLTAPLP